MFNWQIDSVGGAQIEGGEGEEKRKWWLITWGTHVFFPENLD